MHQWCEQKYKGIEDLADMSLLSRLSESCTGHLRAEMWGDVRCDAVNLIDLSGDCLSHNSVLSYSVFQWSMKSSWKCVWFKGLSHSACMSWYYMFLTEYHSVLFLSLMIRSETVKAKMSRNETHVFSNNTYTLCAAAASICIEDNCCSHAVY